MDEPSVIEVVAVGTGQKKTYAYSEILYNTIKELAAMTPSLVFQVELK